MLRAPRLAPRAAPTALASCPRAQNKAFRYYANLILPDKPGVLTPVGGKRPPKTDYPAFTQPLNVVSYIAVPADPRLASLPIVSAAFEPLVKWHRDVNSYVAHVDEGAASGAASSERVLALAEDDEETATLAHPPALELVCYQRGDQGSAFLVGLSQHEKLAFRICEQDSSPVKGSTDERDSLSKNTMLCANAWVRFTKAQAEYVADVWDGRAHWVWLLMLACCTAPQCTAALGCCCLPVAPPPCTALHRTARDVGVCSALPWRSLAGVVLFELACAMIAARCAPLFLPAFVGFRVFSWPRSCLCLLAALPCACCASPIPHC